MQMCVCVRVCVCRLVSAFFFTLHRAFKRHWADLSLTVRRHVAAVLKPLKHFYTADIQTDSL